MYTHFHTHPSCILLMQYQLKRINFIQFNFHCNYSPFSDGVVIFDYLLTVFHASYFDTRYMFFTIWLLVASQMLLNRSQSCNRYARKYRRNI